MEKSNSDFFMSPLNLGSSSSNYQVVIKMGHSFGLLYHQSDDES